MAKCHCAQKTMQGGWVVQTKMALESRRPRVRKFYPAAPETTLPTRDRLLAPVAASRLKACDATHVFLTCGGNVHSTSVRTTHTGCAHWGVPIKPPKYFHLGLLYINMEAILADLHVRARIREPIRELPLVVVVWGCERARQKLHHSMHCA